MTSGNRILLVEDDPALAREMIRALTRENWAMDHVATLADGFEALILYPYRVVLLDRRLPDGDGVSLVAAAKSRPSPPSVIFLTARDEVADRVEGLDAGADDYLVKPFSIDELLARMRAAIRKPRTNERQPLVELAALTFDEASKEVRVRGNPVAIPRGELALIAVLIGRAGRVVQRDHLESELYGFDSEVSKNALETQISRLRRRLAELDAGVELRTVRGVGYMLREC